MDLIRKPFPHAVVSSFLSKLQFTNLSTEVITLQFHKKDADLFSFFQTPDLCNSTNYEIQQFKKHLLSELFLKQLESLTKTKLSRKKLDLFASLYQRTHYLLPHDDQLDGRAVAFMYYLTSLNQDEGGALCLYDSKDNTPTRIQQKIQPQKNTFVFFRVSAKSFHEIKEVLRGNRLTLTGWFYYA